MGFVVRVVGSGVRVGEGVGRGGGGRRRWYRFLPTAQRSSQLEEATGRPWVRQSQAMFQARKVVASTKESWAGRSSLARVGRGRSRWRMRARGGLGWWVEVGL